jgi:hypothetical protein
MVTKRALAPFVFAFFLLFTFNIHSKRTFSTSESSLCEWRRIKRNFLQMKFVRGSKGVRGVVIDRKRFWPSIRPTRIFGKCCRKRKVLFSNFPFPSHFFLEICFLVVIFNVLCMHAQYVFVNWNLQLPPEETFFFLMQI